MREELRDPEEDGKPRDQPDEADVRPAGRKRRGQRRDAAASLQSCAALMQTPPSS